MCGDTQKGGARKKCNSTLFVTIYWMQAISIADLFPRVVRLSLLLYGSHLLVTFWVRLSLTCSNVPHLFYIVSYLIMNNKCSDRSISETSRPFRKLGQTNNSDLPTDRPGYREVSLQISAHLSFSINFCVQAAPDILQVHRDRVPAHHALRFPGIYVLTTHRQDMLQGAVIEHF